MRLFFCFLLIFSLAGCSTDTQQVVTIAAAANMQYAIEEIREAFESETGIKTQVVVSSSGKLSSQIMEGAPFDVFISADTVYPAYLHRNQKTRSAPKVYAHGKLIVWSVHQPVSWEASFLAGQRVAIPNPAVAPYGKAAKQALDSIGLSSQEAAEFVFGESVAQTNQYIASGAVAMGITAYSVIKSAQMQEVGYWAEVPTDLYGTIPQAAVAIRRSGQMEKETLRFLEFLSSDTARSILDKFGYLVADS